MEEWKKGPWVAVQRYRVASTCQHAGHSLLWRSLCTVSCRTRRLIYIYIYIHTYIHTHTLYIYIYIHTLCIYIYIYVSFLAKGPCSSEGGQVTWREFTIKHPGSKKLEDFPFSRGNSPLGNKSQLR